jgi:nickel-dependent lactate racemase
MPLPHKSLLRNLMLAQATSPTHLSPDAIEQVLDQALAGQHAGERVLVLIPDHTRTIPLPQLFRLLVELLHDASQLDFMVALGTHPALSEGQLEQLVGISAAERTSDFRHVGLLNHAWNETDTLVQIGTLASDEIRVLAGERWHPSLQGDVPVRINRHIFDYDHVLILGPTFPHEVAGFSGGAKYLFPGISGPEMINVSHWLGALVGVVDTIGVAETPVRAMMHAAAAKVDVPITLIALVVVDDAQLAGVFVGDLIEAWRAAAALSSQRHIIWVDKPFQRVLSCAPPMYDELWTAGKAMYKLEPALAQGGELTIFSPTLDVVSHVHGDYIYQIGYHVLDYFLAQWDEFKDVPLGVVAHSTHVRGGGRYIDGVELPNATVNLATQLSPADCAQLALGYVDPATIDQDAWRNREDEGILFVPKAGEMLYRVRKS